MVVVRLEGVQQCGRQGIHNYQQAITTRLQTLGSNRYVDGRPRVPKTRGFQNKPSSSGNSRTRMGYALGFPAKALP